MELVARLPAAVGAAIADLDDDRTHVLRLVRGAQKRRIVARWALRTAFAGHSQPRLAIDDAEWTIAIVAEDLQVWVRPVDVEAIADREVRHALCRRLDLEWLHRDEVVQAVQASELLIRGF